MNPFIRVVGLGAATLAVTGCASMFLNGGHFSDGSEKNRIIAKYHVESCVNTADGSPMQGTSNAEYWLIGDPGGVALAEMDRTGQGTVITNHWVEADGDHFFASVTNSGWEYVVPADHTKPGTRVVYTGVQTGNTGGATKPVSSPAAKCPLTPLQAGPAVAAATPAPAPAQ